MGFRNPLAACIALAGLLVPGAARGQDVIINELYYHPGAGASADAEYMELYNRGANAVDISNWTISNGVVYTFPISTVIPAGGYLVIAKNAALVQAATGFLTPYQWTSGSLDNAGETVTISNASAVIVDSVTYSDDPPWPVSPDGSGPSLELLNPFLDNNVFSSWAASSVTHGTPGAVNSTFVDAPLVSAIQPTPQTGVPDLATISVTFNRVVTGVAAGSLTVNGSAATAMSGSGAGPYEFSGYTVPTGPATVVISGAGIVDGQNIPFGGSMWTYSVGQVIVFNEIHYHPNETAHPAQDTEFVELYNAGSISVDLSNWIFSDGVVFTFPNGTTLAAGAYLVVAVNPTALQQATGYAGALQWTSGALSNSGERIALSDNFQNLIDAVTFADSGEWPGPADGDGPSLELINPAFANDFGPAWQASIPNNGTPGAQNSVYQSAVAPLILSTRHEPVIPVASQPVTITTTVVDDSPNPTVMLYYRQDADPTVAYASIQMFDDGQNGDGAANDKRYGAIIPGLPDGARLDFTIRADDGMNMGAPAGHDTLAAGQYPTRTYLCKFSDNPLPSDFPSYHMITTQRVRNQQNNHTEDEYDAAFVHCDTLGNCKNWYNITEHYRGASSLNQHPHSFRLDLPASNPLQSEMGFAIRKLILNSQSIDKQYLGSQYFREVFGNTIPTVRTQFVRFNTNPLSHGGIQDFVYHNIEVVDGDFCDSQSGDVSPLRFPDRCTDSLAPCLNDGQCGGMATCESTDNGNLYRARGNSASLVYLGNNPNPYRAVNEAEGYEKLTNETEDDWTDLIALCFAFDPGTTPDAMLEQSLSPLIDEEEWTRWFAVHMLLVNQEGGFYRDTGDDYFVYLQPLSSPGGYNAKLIPWDMDSTFGGFGGAFNQETIWRTNLYTSQRFVRHNAYAGRFVKAICDMLNNEFTQAAMDARIDALPNAVSDAARKLALKNWVAARRTFVQNEIKTQTTFVNPPANPYTNPNPLVTLGGQLNQCGTRFVRVNGVSIDTFSVYNATWSRQVTLYPGFNHVTVQSLDHNNQILDSATTTILYDPVVLAGLRLTAPTRMVDNKTLTLKAEKLDENGAIDWRTCGEVGTVSAARYDDGTPVPTTVTVFETFPDGAGGGGPAPGTIRFYNGVGSVSLTLDTGAATAPGDIVVTVTLGTMNASRIVTVLDGDAPGLYKNLAGTLSGPDLTWGPSDGVIHLTDDVDVPIGSALTILPGTLIMVDSGEPFNGTAITTTDSTVHANGLRTDPIFFFPTAGPAAMTLPQNGPNNDIAWRGIYHSGIGTSTYDHVFITGAGNAVITGHPRPPIFRFFHSHSVVMQDCVFADCPGMGQTAITENGSFTFQRCLFSRLGIGGEWIGAGYTLTIDNCWFTRIGRAPEPNGVDGDILHIDSGGNTANVRRSVLTDCGDDMIDHSTGANPVIRNCLIYDCRDKVVSLDASPGGTITMVNCLIFNAPGGIRCSNKPAFLTNCTLGWSTSLVGPSCTGSIVHRCIFWGTSTPTCCGNVSYTLVEIPADLGCGTGNFSADPLFVNNTCDYSLQAGSPALTAGPGGTQIGWLAFPGCVEAGGCDDQNPCTMDICDNGICVNTQIPNCIPCNDPTPCDDGNPCTLDECINGVCVNTPLANATPCSDGDVCNGLETCQGGVCTPGTPLNCDDGIGCTIDSCNPTTGCAHVNNCPATVTAVGSRYLKIIPPAGAPSVALRIECASMACFPKYVDAGGLLTDTPVFRSSAEWGEVYVGDRAIVPSMLYDVRTDIRLPNEPENLSPPTSATTWTWGDVDHAGGVNVLDIVCLLDGFQNIHTTCSLYADDLRHNVPDRLINVFDIVGVLDAYQSLPYPDATPCAPPVPAPEGDATSIVSLVPRRRQIAPGESVAVDVYVLATPALRGYQLQTCATGAAGAAGGLRLQSAAVDETHTDYAFAGQPTQVAITPQGRLANVRLAGVSDCTPVRYLATFVWTAGRTASGTYLISTCSGGDSILVDAAGNAIPFESHSTRVSVVRARGGTSTGNTGG